MTTDQDAAAADGEWIDPGGFESVLVAGARRGLGEKIPAAELLRTGAALLRRRGQTARRVRELVGQLDRIARDDDPLPLRDRRFADPAWHENPLLRRLACAYLAACETTREVVADAELDWRSNERVGLFIENVLAAAAPTNNPAVNPSTWKRVIDTAGLSLVRGARNFVTDMSSRPRLPAMVDGSGFSLGENVATTPGKVVFRNDLCELIQYAPTTARVDATAVLLVSSPVNKFYLLDLDPGASVTAAHVAAGRQVFTMSWVNPDRTHAENSLDAYVASVREALLAVTAITGTARVHLLGLCGGGLIAATTAAYLAAAGEQDRLATLTLAITVVDQTRAGVTGALLDRGLAKRALRRATKDQLFDGNDSAVAFAWLRPNDGIWANVVNDYLLGRRPPAASLLYWAADQTNISLGLGRDLLDVMVDNSLTKPGAARVLDQPVDLSRIAVDTYILAGSTDHITPWRSGYRTRRLLGGATTFVLARGGHAAVIATPPTSTRASYRTGDANPDSADEWLSTSAEHQGSWWGHWTEWIHQHTPDSTPAPTALGSSRYPPLCDAPGSYVRQRLDVSSP